MNAVPNTIEEDDRFRPHSKVLILAVLVSLLVHFAIWQTWSRFGEQNKFEDVHIETTLAAAVRHRVPPAPKTAEKPVEKPAEKIAKPQAVPPAQPTSTATLPHKPAANQAHPKQTLPKQAAKQPALSAEKTASENAKLADQSAQAANTNAANTANTANNANAANTANAANPANPASQPANQTPAPPTPTATTTPAGFQLPDKGRLNFTVYYGEYDAPTKSTVMQSDSGNAHTNSLVGHAMQEWEIKNGSYRIHSLLNTAGFVAFFKSYRIEQESRGRLSANGIQPETLKTFRNGKETDESAKFDWSNNTVYLGRGDQTKSVGANAQDLVTFPFHLGYSSNLQQGVRFMVATGKKFEEYVFNYVGEEQLNLPIGQVNTLHLRTERGPTSLDIWLAPDQLMLPVKTRLVDKEGRIATQVIDKIELGK